MTNEEDLLYKKYLRLGHIDQGRLCDSLANEAFRLLPGEFMPPRWQMLPPEEFVCKYGEGQKWASAKNYQLFILNGHPLFRIWTRTKSDFAWVDLNEVLSKPMGVLVEIEPIPEGILKKCKPFMYRFRAFSELQIQGLIDCVRYIYGLEIS